MLPTLSNIRLLVINGDAVFLDLLKASLLEMGSEHLYTASTEEEGFQLFQECDPDVCITDVELRPGKRDGLRLARSIRKEAAQMPILFLTSLFREDVYASVKQVRPVAFLHKEASRLTLLQAIELAAPKPILLAKRETNEPSPHHKSTSLISNHHWNSKQIFFKVGNIYKPIPIKDIDFFYADNKLTYARSAGRNYPTVTQLKVISKELHPHFLRCHKKYLINTDRIDSILLREGKVKVGEELFTIGYAYRKQFIRDINLLK